MELARLTKDHLTEIIRLYEVHCGFRRAPEETMGSLPPYTHTLADLRRFRSVEYRLGSRWDPHSKLWIEVDNKDKISVRFTSNFDVRARKGAAYKKAEKAGKDFQDAVAAYLSSQ